MWSNQISHKSICYWRGKEHLQPLAQCTSSLSLSLSLLLSLSLSFFLSVHHSVLRWREKTELCSYNKIFSRGLTTHDVLTAQVMEVNESINNPSFWQQIELPIIPSSLRTGTHTQQQHTATVSRSATHARKGQETGANFEINHTVLLKMCHERVWIYWP